MADDIRHAASVIAVREGGNGPEVLVVERGRQSRFLAGYVVFPGGAVDAADAELAERWFGNAADAARAAAVRELVEEACLALTAHGLVSSSTLDPVHDWPPPVALLHELARWVAPHDVPVRFDARYFTLRAARGLTATPDGTEAARAWWASPRDLLAEWERGSRKLYWPTYATMLELARHDAVESLLAATFETREPDDADLARLPRSVFWED